MKALLISVLIALLLPTYLAADGKFITLASTTSTQNSGLFDAILPLFTKETGIEVRVVAVGTGQALRIARNGDADAILVHHRPSEEKFISDGHGLGRLDIMFNDFVIVGPSSDPAGIGSAKTAAAAFEKIAAAETRFASRGDNSGTHLKEQELWAQSKQLPKGNWYLETGSGMGATLNLSQSLDSYTLTDRGTWITFGNKGDLELLFQGGEELFNPYGVILVNPRKHPHAKIGLSQQLANWLVSEQGQLAIGNFRIDGVQAFCPNAEGLPFEIAARSACASGSH